MDFIKKLLESEGYRNMIMITDQLSKGIITDRLLDLEAETVAKWFIKQYYLYYFLPFIIVLDHRTQFTSIL